MYMQKSSIFKISRNLLQDPYPKKVPVQTSNPRGQTRAGRPILFTWLTVKVQELPFVKFEWVEDNNLE